MFHQIKKIQLASLTVSTSQAEVEKDLIPYR